MTWRWALLIGLAILSALVLAYIRLAIPVAYSVF